jgi:acyl dehydratase
LIKESITVEELQKEIGTEAKPVEFKLEKELIRRFVQAVGDSNPLWQDEEYAQKAQYGGIVAPPWLLCALMTVSLADSRTGSVPLLVPEVPPPRKHILDGGQEWELFLPLKLGDIITSHSKLANVFEREGKVGKMLFFVYETSYTNQRGEVVARSSCTLINY